MPLFVVANVHGACGWILARSVITVIFLPVLEESGVMMRVGGFFVLHIGN